MENLLNKIHHADCFEFMDKIPDKSIDLILTDPLYGIGWQSGRRIKKYKKIENDNNLHWLHSFMNKVKRILKDDGCIYVFCSWHNVDIFKSEIQKLIPVKNILIWNKNNFGSGDLYADYAPKYEMIIFCNPKRKYLNGKRIPNVLNFKKTRNEFCPTQKPIDLFETLIEKTTNKGDIVFDPFSGSGVTAIAAYNLKRQFICVEKDYDYYKKSNERFLLNNLKKI